MRPILWNDMTLHVYESVRWDSEELVSMTKVLPDHANESEQIKTKRNMTPYIHHTSPTLQIRPLKKIDVNKMHAVYNYC